jgi:cobalamin synthase
MSRMTTFLKLVAQTKPARERKGTLLKELNDPVKTAIFALLVFVLALTSIITTFIGSVLLASTNVKNCEPEYK